MSKISDILEGDLVTKQDLLNSENSLKNGLNRLEAKFETSVDRLDRKIDTAVQNFENKMLQLEYRMTIKLGSIVTVAFAAMTAIIKFI